MKKTLKKWKKRQKKCRKHVFFEISRFFPKTVDVFSQISLRNHPRFTPFTTVKTIKFSLFFTFFHFFSLSAWDPHSKGKFRPPRPLKKWKKREKSAKKMQISRFDPKPCSKGKFRPPNPKKCTNFVFFCMFCARFFHVLYPRFETEISTPQTLKKWQKKCPFWGFFTRFPNATVENSLKKRRNPAKRLRCLFKYIYSRI